jgi:hypothetical protein
VEADPASNNRDLQDMVASQLLQFKGQQRLNQEVVTADHNLVQLDTLVAQDRASKGTAMAQYPNNTHKVQVAITAVDNSRRKSNAKVFHPAADHISCSSTKFRKLWRPGPTASIRWWVQWAISWTNSEA